MCAATPLDDIRCAGPNMTNSSTTQWTLLLSLTALLLSLVVLAQLASRYVTAYFAAPHEIVSFIDTVDSSISENESYDRDVARVQRLEDKLRLGRLLRDIQRGSDELREELNGLLVGEDDSRSRMSARLLWAGMRVHLEERVRRLDLLRMRFLVIYMGIVAGTSAETAAKRSKEGDKGKDPEKLGFHEYRHQESARRLPSGITEGIKEGIKAKPPLRRLTTQSIGHQESTAIPHRVGWAGVVKELQLSPRLLQRHASIERAMSETPSKAPMPATPTTPKLRSLSSLGREE
ncbi:hypothetical protein DL546_005469 [Coniochaeta pulveracea]|uniref:Uncharacterized protein n=1 Tax=Coniochaeta pulveracea TaxID=177199 RepID=A0A420YCY8_9PEZI|nr:hypothetical protein DL546_005469 [Coniochaeta pulveracea]